MQKNVRILLEVKMTGIVQKNYVRTHLTKETSCDSERQTRKFSHFIVRACRSWRQDAEIFWHGKINEVQRVTQF